MRALFNSELDAQVVATVKEMEQLHNCFIILMAERKTVYMCVLTMDGKASDNILLAVDGSKDKICTNIRKYFRGEQ